jgi:creatinine amidohydrolase
MEHRLAQLTRLEAGERARAGAICLVPVGSLEQHGEHLPVFTDSLLAEHMCLEAARRARSDVLVTPPLWTGFSPHHLRFGATVTLGSSTFAALVRETVASLRSWCTRVIVVNGHGGNRGPLITLGVEDAVESVNYWELMSGGRLAELFPFDLGSVGHAGEFETSVMLESFRGLVGEPGLDHEPIEVEGAAFLVPDMGASGVLGDPRAATAEAGRAVLDEVVGALVALLDGGAGSDDRDEEVGFADSTKEETE